MDHDGVMSGFDVIGDVHGQVGRLESLLTQMDYRVSRGAWRHPDVRVAVFVGDLIDRRRDHQLATLRVVRSMVEAGSAKVVLGNHEFNAVAYATVPPVQFDYCREHSSKHWRQHREFLDEVEFGSPLHRSVIDWFRSLPLWLDLGGCGEVALVGSLRRHAPCSGRHPRGDATARGGRHGDRRVARHTARRGRGLPVHGLGAGDLRPLLADGQAPGRRLQNRAHRMRRLQRGQGRPARRVPLVAGPDEAHGGASDRRLIGVLVHVRGRRTWFVGIP